MTYCTNPTSDKVILQVRNLDLCRKFYSGTLFPEPPVMDSSFLVEFREGGFHLVLESPPWETLPDPAQCRAGWYFEAEDPEELCRKVREFSGENAPQEKVKKGNRCLYRCQDPEGNCFYIPCKQDSRKEEGK